MTRINKRLAAYLAGGLVCGLVVGAAPSFSQNTDKDSQESQGGLEEVTVTARKVTESLVEVPVTITAVTAQSMEDMGIEDRNSLKNFTPGFYYPPGNIASATRLVSSYQVRGLGAVNAFWNGAPLNGGDVPELLDLERVEVLKGPQNAYFGRSTFSGAINYVAAEPSFDTHGYLEAEDATRGNTTYKGGLEGTLIPGILAGRVAGSYRETNADYNNFGYVGTVGEQRTTAGTISLLFTPIDGLKIRVYGAKWEDNDGPNAIAYYQAGDNNCNAGAAPAGTFNYICGGQNRANLSGISQLYNFPVGAIAAIEPIATQSTVGPNFINGNGFKRIGEIGQVFIDYTLPMNFTASLLGSYDRNAAGQIQDYGNREYADPATYNPSLTTYLLRDRYIEGRVTSDPNASVRGLLGASYVYSTQGIQSVINKSGIPSISFPPTILYSNTLGIFGSVSYDFLKDFTATVDGRWQQDEVGQNTINVSNLNGTTVSFVPRAIVEYHLTKTAQVYASFSEGTRPGALNNGFLALPAYAQAQVSAQFKVPATVPEEKLYNYEIGVKGDFFDGTLRSLSALYYAKDRGRQIQAALFYTNLLGVLAQANVTAGSGSVNAAGFEQELTWVPNEHWSADGTFAYNHTRIISTACTTCAILTGNGDPAGNSIEGYPIMTASLGLNFKWHAFDYKNVPYEAYSRIDAVYQGKEYADETNLTWLDPSVVANLRVGLDNGTYKLEIYAENINQNKVPQTIGNTTDQISGAQTISMIPALQPIVGIRVIAKF